MASNGPFKKDAWTRVGFRLHKGSSAAWATDQSPKAGCSQSILPPLHITLSSLVHWCPLPTVARKTMPWTTAHNHNCCKQTRQQLGATLRFKKVCVNTVSYGFIWFYVWFVSAHHSFAQGSRFRTLAVFGCFCLTEMPWYAGSISLWLFIIIYT